MLRVPIYRPPFLYNFPTQKLEAVKPSPLSTIETQDLGKQNVVQAGRGPGSGLGARAGAVVVKAGKIGILVVVVTSMHNHKKTPPFFTFDVSDSFR
jgi:hypothetical protein